MKKHYLFPILFITLLLFSSNPFLNERLITIYEDGSKIENIYSPKIDNLRFRDFPSLNSNVIRIFKKGENLVLLGEGFEETIDGVKGKWIKVRTSRKETGWCFDAYLDIIKLNDNYNNEKKKYFFKSDILGIQFEYPENWGKIEGTYVEFKKDLKYVSGSSYDFKFNNKPGYDSLSVSSSNITAGGRSNDYSMPRGGYISDFYGFRNMTTNELCKKFHAVTYNKINENMISMLVIPKYDDICPPNPGQYWFSKVLIIDLPNKSKINGLVFSYIFLSSTLSEEISDECKEIFGEKYINCYDCNDAARNAFDNLAKNIFESIQNKTIDKETLENINNFDNFVHSIKILNK